MPRMVRANRLGVTAIRIKRRRGPERSHFPARFSHPAKRAAGRRYDSSLWSDILILLIARFEIVSRYLPPKPRRLLFGQPTKLFQLVSSGPFRGWVAPRHSAFLRLASRLQS